MVIDVADGFCPTRGEGRRTFFVEAEACADALLRILGPFAVQGASVHEMEAGERAGRLSVRLEVAGLTLARAEHLAERLRGLAMVRGVALGWRAQA